MLNQINEQKIDRLADLLNVLADPTRMRIILGLTKPSSMNSLQQHLQIGHIALLQHLTQMQVNGLLNSESRNGETFYSLTDINVNRAIQLLVVKPTLSNVSYNA